jgi:hypothetical protein
MTIAMCAILLFDEHWIVARKKFEQLKSRIPYLLIYKRTQAQDATRNSGMTRLDENKPMVAIRPAK